MSRERLTPQEELELIREVANDGSPVTSSLRVEDLGVKEDVATIVDANEEDRFHPPY